MDSNEHKKKAKQIIRPEKTTSGEQKKELRRELLGKLLDEKPEVSEDVPSSADLIREDRDR